MMKMTEVNDQQQQYQQVHPILGCCELDSLNESVKAGKEQTKILKSDVVFLQLSGIQF